VCETVPNDDRNTAAFLIADPAGRCTQVNPRWTEITGLDSKMSSGDGWLNLAHPDDRERLREEWEACVLRQGDLAVTVRLQTSGDPIDLRAAAMPAGYVVTLEIGETERDEAELLHARKMEAVGRLASGLAHDFANLLTLISGYSEILLGRMHLSDPSRPEVDEIHKAANRGAGLTSQLLAYSRRHAVEPQVLNLNALVANMQSMLRRMIGEHIDLGTQLAAELGSVKADAGQIEQVIMNLAINARDAMPRGGKITIRTANVEVGPDHERAGFGTQPGRYVMLQVTDTGQGINPEALEHLFEPFFTTKEKGKGTGLGLATVYGIVKQGRGDVWAQSEPGKGSTFTIYLPRVADRSAAVEPGAASRAAQSGTETILMVEDEDSVRRLLKHVLSKNGYTVIEAAGGPEALALYEQLRRPIDLLLTDIVMPGMNGRELAERMVELQPGLRIIYMSGYTDEALAGPGTIAALFLPKPLRPDALAARVREVLDGPSALSADRAANRASTAPV
jgi:two-component system, cell cycle sensor histidine kinase and response regulator CckA